MNFGLPASHEVLCERCGLRVDPRFAEHSGGLCGDCLADDALALTRIALAEDS